MDTYFRATDYRVHAADRVPRKCSRPLRRSSCQASGLHPASEEQLLSWSRCQSPRAGSRFTSLIDGLYFGHRSNRLRNSSRAQTVPAQVRFDRGTSRGSKAISAYQSQVFSAIPANHYKNIPLASPRTRKESGIRLTPPQAVEACDGRAYDHADLPWEAVSRSGEQARGDNAAHVRGRAHCARSSETRVIAAK